MSNMITLTIDGITATVPEGTTIRDAAKSIGVRIPTLCYLKDLNEIGACRICVVDVGSRSLAAACVLPVADEMVVRTNTPEIRDARKTNLELVLSNHDKRCLSCLRSTNCELQSLCNEYGVNDENQYEGAMTPHEVDALSVSIVRNNKKCILCRRCVAVCEKVQQVNVIGAVNRGFDTSIGSPFDMPLAHTACINCGQCVSVCPTGALTEKDDTAEVFAAIADPDKYVVVQTAPAVRAALGEEFGMPMGISVTGKMVTALRRLGFDKVFDTDFAADLTIMEEGYELIDRLTNGGVLPVITSCSPGWVKYCETFYPQFLPNLSSCKSPHEMEGAVIKTYFADKNDIDPRKIVVVSIMPCTAKKFEAKRSELGHKGLPDVDIVITTRELARMLKKASVDFANLPDGDFDAMLGDSTGASVIFGATGGVMEAALRTAYEVVTGKTLAKVEFAAVRGLEHIKEAEIDLDGTKLNVAVAHSTGAAAKLLEMVEAGEKEYAFIEVMACPGGCVNGGGQPLVSPEVRERIDPRAVRAKALYGEDEAKAIRKSHENPEIKTLYQDFLGEPNSHLAHELLHTHYEARPKYR